MRCVVLGWLGWFCLVQFDDVCATAFCFVCVELRFVFAWLSYFVLVCFVLYRCVCVVLYRIVM